MYGWISHLCRRSSIFESHLDLNLTIENNPSDQIELEGKDQETNEKREDEENNGNNIEDHASTQ